MKWEIKEHADIDSKILLYGASGTGKTSSAYGLAKDLGQRRFSILIAPKCYQCMLARVKKMCVESLMNIML